MVEIGAVGDARNVMSAVQDGLQLVGVKLERVTPLGNGVVRLKVTGVVTLPVRTAAAPTVLGSPPGMRKSGAPTMPNVKLKPGGRTNRAKIAVLVIPPPTACI